MSFLKIIIYFYGIRAKNTKLEGDQTIVATTFYVVNRLLYRYKTKVVFSIRYKPGDDPGKN